jgi:hypothetical protein
MAMTKVAEVTVGSGGAASITFTGIPQTGKDLLALFSLRSSSGGGAVANGQLTINGSGSGYTERLLVTIDGSSVFSTSSSSPIRHYLVGDTATANTFSNQSFYFSNYTSTTTKSYSVDGVTENNATAAGLYITAGNQTSSVPITSLTIEPWSGGGWGPFVQHSTASLYIIS